MKRRAVLVIIVLQPHVRTVLLSLGLFALSRDIVCVDKESGESDGGKKKKKKKKKGSKTMKASTRPTTRASARLKSQSSPGKIWMKGPYYVCFSLPVGTKKTQEFVER